MEKKRRTIPLNQKVKYILTLYGVYDFHNNFRYFDFYSNQNSENFIKFIKKVIRNFNDKIYIILDNHGSHISKYTKEELKKNKNVKLVFLPYNSPKLNRIEDEFSLYKREVLANRKFKSKKEIIIASRKWINYRNNMGIKIVNK